MRAQLRLVSGCMQTLPTLVRDYLGQGAALDEANLRLLGDAIRSHGVFEGLMNCDPADAPIIRRLVEYRGGPNPLVREMCAITVKLYTHCSLSLGDRPPTNQQMLQEMDDMISPRYFDRLLDEHLRRLNHVRDPSERGRTGSEILSGLVQRCRQPAAEMLRHIRERGLDVCFHDRNFDTLHQYLWSETLARRLIHGGLREELDRRAPVEGRERAPELVLNDLLNHRFGEARQLREENRQLREDAREAHQLREENRRLREELQRLRMQPGPQADLERSRWLPDPNPPPAVPANLGDAWRDETPAPPERWADDPRPGLGLERRQEDVRPTAHLPPPPWSSEDPAPMLRAAPIVRAPPPPSAQPSASPNLQGGASLGLPQEGPSFAWRTNAPEFVPGRATGMPAYDVVDSHQEEEGARTPSEEDDYLPPPEPMPAMNFAPPPGLGRPPSPSRAEGRQHLRPSPPLNSFHAPLGGDGVPAGTLRPTPPYP